MTRLRDMTKPFMKQGVPEFGPGDQVRVWYRIKEKDRTRQVPFEGLVIRRRGSGMGETCTIRRVTYGEGVERIFPLHAPVVERIEVLRQGMVKRARLYYLRTKVGKTRLSAQRGSGQAEGASREAAGPTAPSAETPAAVPPSAAEPSPAS